VEVKSGDTVVEQLAGGVTVSLTGAAQAVLAHHEAFHAGLVRAVAQGLPVDELDALGSALARLHHYFNTL